ncbi:MAG: acyltransferase family protein [Lachnospiraceae bacterium]|nr:acyltransferase family protein [Lachnospiraceae bacterium]
MEQTKRLPYLDMVKGLGIILVVLGHIEYISDPLRTWISSFHMPVFFIVSGLLICHKNEDALPFKTILTKKSHGILIPYFWFSLLYLVIDIFNVCFGKITRPDFIKNQIASVTFYGSSVLWFLPALFLAEIGFLFLHKKLPKYISIPLILLLAILAYCLELSVRPVYEASSDALLITTLIDFLRVFLRGALFMSFVCFAFHLYPLLTKGERFSILQLIAGIVFFVLNLALSQINGCVDTHFLKLNNVPLFYLCAVLGSVSLILICKNLSPKYLGPLMFFGKNSLVVMTTHLNTYILYFAQLIAWQIDTVVTRAKSYVFIFNIMIFTFLFEALIIVIINRFFPFVLGKGTLLCRKKD